jgi:hypothetical protein
MSFKSTNIQNLFSSLIFISLLNLVFNPINLYFGFTLLIFFVLIFVYFNHANIALLPFYFYPFYFLFKNQYPENFLFSILPEISVLISFIYIFFDQKIKICEKHLIFLILLLSFTLTFFNFLSILNIYFLPALIRQYSFPLIFLFFFITISLKNHKLPREAFRICIIAYGVVAIIALLNYFDTINIFQTTFSREFIGCSIEIGQTFLPCKDLKYIMRLNPLLGGSVGTAASILCVLTIVIILNFKNIGSHLIIFVIPLFLTILFAASFSTIIPISISIGVIVLSKYSMYLKQISIILLIIFVLFITKFGLYGEKSIFTYFKLTVLDGLIDFYSKIDLINIFFGSGPVINSNKFEYFPNNFIQDIGILRVLTETGIFNFMILIIILFYVLKKNIWLISNIPSNFNKSLLIMFLSLLSSFHTIIFLTVPFYPLFVMIVSNIIVEYNLANKPVN